MMLADLSIGMAQDMGPLGAFAALWGGIMGVFGLIYCLAFFIGIAVLVLWIWALVDCLKRDDYKGENEKLLWVLVILFAGIIGALIYYFLVKRKSDKSQITETPKESFVK